MKSSNHEISKFFRFWKIFRFKQQKKSQESISRSISISLGTANATKFPALKTDTIVSAGLTNANWVKA